MPNFASALKEEITRLTRKEVRNQIEKVKKASSQHRSDLAALKRHVAKLQSQVALLERHALKTPAVSGSEPSERPRFTAKGLQSQRKRLGLSASDYALLVGVNFQSIYNWEQGKTKPRKEQIAKLAALRGIGKKEALARLRLLTKGKSQEG